MKLKKIIDWRIILYCTMLLYLYVGFFHFIVLLFIPSHLVSPIGIFLVSILAGKYSYRHGWLYGLFLVGFLAVFPFIPYFLSGAFLANLYTGNEVPVFKTIFSSLIINAPIGLIGGLIGQVFLETPSKFLTDGEIFKRYKIKKDLTSLCEAMKNKDVNIKIAVLRELEKREDKNAVVEIFESAWKNEDEEMRRKGLMFDHGPYLFLHGALSALWSRRAYEEPEAYLRIGLLKAIYGIKKKEGLAIVVEALKDNNEIVRYAALSILKEEMDSSIVPYVINMLNDSSIPIRKEAAGLLSKHFGEKLKLDIHVRDTLEEREQSIKKFLDELKIDLVQSRN